MLAPPLAAKEPHKHSKGEHKDAKALLTFYWIIDESSSRYGGKQVAELRDVRGHLIARTSRKFRKALVMEGSGWLRDGRVVMYDRKVGGEHRFRLTPSKYGFTVTGCALVPYRTVAVDPHVIRLGSTIYIPQLKGAVLPDGTTHDGMFIATDRGHFRGRHIDIFVGAGHRGSAPFIRKGYGSRSRVTVKVVRADGGCRP
jgi:3D (Asp-Asp-Asp) domain-containing protein